MKILIITPYLPYPDVPHGGGQDLFHLIDFLRPRHSISLASFTDATQAAHAAGIRPYVEALTVIRPAITLRQKIARLAEDGWRSLAQRADAQMRSTIRATKPDVLYAAWTEMGRYLNEAPPGCVRVLDEVDVHFIAEPDPVKKAGELAYCRAADLVVTRSARDLAVLRTELPSLHGVVLPPVGHTTEFLTIRPEECQPGSILFMGAMNRRRNQSAARWLIESVWPLVRAAVPAATLRIVGADPPPDLLAISGRNGITVTGWVADLRAEYASASVVVAPMHSEAGALNKVIDGLAAGRPVVATPQANGGVGAPHDAIRLADKPAEFAAAIVTLLQGDDHWQLIAGAGRLFATANFDWQAAAQNLEANLLELTA